MKIVITGATGFIGRPLCVDFLNAGHTVTALSRNAGRARAILSPQVKSLEWGRQAGDEWKRAVAEADIVVHLAGEPVAGERWTPEVKAKIRASRVEPTRALMEAMRASDRKPGVFLSASAVGYYGDRGEETVTEESPPGQGFLAEVCREWEAEAQAAEAFGARVARMRIGFVLGEGGGLEKMLQPLPVPLSPWKLGLGGPMGSGKQWLPWIHRDDVIGLFLWAAANPQAQGAINVTAPQPVRNAEFAHALGRALHRPAALPVPAFALRALVGEFADVLLTGQKALPTVAQKLGYIFKYPDVDSALRSLLDKR